MELEALGAARQRHAGVDRGGGIEGKGRFGCRLQPGEVAAQQRDVHAELARGVEGVAVQEVRRLLRGGDGLVAQPLAKGENRVPVGPPREMLVEEASGGGRIGLPATLELDEFRIGEKRRFRGAGPRSQDGIVVRAGKREQARSVEVIEFARARIDPVDRDRRLRMLETIGDAARVRQPERVDLDEHHPAARDLLSHMGFDRIVEGEFGDLEAVELEEVLERHLREGEMIAFEILGDRETQGCLERIAAVLQGVHDNYDIDLFRALIRASADLTGVDADGPQRASHRVIADHLRASAFLVADGVLPSNEGRGYVLRRIMRRAMRHAQLLGARDPLMWRLVPALTREMGQAYPELIRAESLISETLKLEETRFRSTLVRGLAILEDETRSLGDGGVLNGETAFRLYDTYGFPLDLTQDALRARGLSVDTEGFNSTMERQRADARRAWSGSGEAATETIWYGLRERVGATEFLGYETEAAEGVISAIVRDGVEVETLAAGERGSLILNQTPFYGESGGQVGDVGEIIASGFRAEVTDTRKKLGDLVVHDVMIVEGAASLGLAVELQVNHDARTATRANHSATHILHEALRIVLGDHVAQKGSLVSPERLRFDIAHPKPITRAELEKVEDIANHVVLENAEVTTRLMGLDDARASGARALFGEKYGDEVRVVTMGEIEDGHEHERTYSIELCGGTHVHRTGDIGLITIVGESAVAAGVRRIEAKTRDEARKRLEADSRAYGDLAALLRAPAGEATERLEALIETGASSSANSPTPGANWRWAAEGLRRPTLRATSPASSFTPAR